MKWLSPKWVSSKWVSKFKAHSKPSQHETPLADDAIPVLAVIPDRPDRQYLDEIACRAHWSLEFVPTLDSGKEALRHAVKPVIICDRDLPGCHWRQAIEVLVASAPGSVVLLASSHDEESLWEEVVRVGGYDVLRKPFDFDRVTHKVHFAWMYWKFNNRHLTVSKEKVKAPRSS